VKQKFIELNDVKCILGKTNIGLYENHLIDTAVVDAPLDLKGILITHGHADHFAWASTLQKRTRALVVAPKEDAFLIENPELNARGMFNWARPPVEMTTKFFIGEPCKVDRYTEEYPFEGNIAPLLLSGHTMGHTGFLCNGVLFAGDALYPKATWERLAQIDAMILRLLERARSTEDLIYDVLKELNVQDNLAQYWLSVTTIKGHLSGLVSTYKVAYDITDHRVYWKLNE